jgi:hypothetical protein
VSFDHEQCRTKIKIGFWQNSPRAIPWLWQRHLLNSYRQKYNDLVREDRSTFNRMFRPGFIQGYKKCMVQGGGYNAETMQKSKKFY